MHLGDISLGMPHYVICHCARSTGDTDLGESPQQMQGISFLPTCTVRGRRERQTEETKGQQDKRRLYRRVPRLCQLHSTFYSRAS